MADLRLTVKVITEGTRALSNLGGDLQRVGRGLTIGVTTPLIAAGAGMLNMAADAEQAQAKLQSTFDSMGASAFTTVDALNAQAEAMAAATTFDDDAIKEAQATLLTFGNVTGESFDRATAAALDMSAFFGTDLQAASVQLGKALNDPIAGLSALSRIGVSFTEEQKALIETMVAAGDTAGAQGIILGEVERQLGGVAEDLAATSGGQLTQAMNQLGEAGESLGSLLLPALTGLANGLKAVAGWFNNLSPEGQKFVAMLAGVAAAIGPVIFIGGKLVGTFKTIGTAFTILKTLMLANPYAALITATVAIVTLIITNWDKITAMFKKALDFISGVGKKLWTPISEGFGAAIDFIRGIWNSFASWWNSIEISIPSVDIPFVGRVGGFTIGLPDLPMLAEGGIVNKPTLALLGEAGPEAVVPLSQMGQGGVVINVTVNGDLRADDEDSLADAIGRSLWVTGMSDRVLSNG